jgi:hypothetical protein
MTEGKERIKYKERTKDFPIWKLTEICYILDRRLWELKEQGASSNEKRVKNVHKRRNIFREILLEKLKLWKKGELKEEITFADTQENHEQDIIEVIN